MPAVLAGVFLTVVCALYVLFDLLPKMLSCAYPNRLCRLAGVPMLRFIHLGLHPLVAPVEAVRGKSCAEQAGSGQTRQSGADMSDA